MSASTFYNMFAGIGQGFNDGFARGRELKLQNMQLADLEEQKQRDLQGLNTYYDMYSSNNAQPQQRMTLASLGQRPERPKPIDRNAQRVNNAFGAAGLNIPESYFQATKAAESSGRVDARNPRSSATGLYQFTKGTWDSLARNRPDLKLTPKGRFDPEQQERAMRAFTQQNARIIGSSDPADLYAAHFLGAGDARRVLKMPDNVPMSQAVASNVINANPFLRDMSVGDFKAWTARKMNVGQDSTVATYDPSQAQQERLAPISREQFMSIMQSRLVPAEMKQQLVQGRQRGWETFEYGNGGIMQRSPDGQLKIVAEPQEAISNTPDFKTEQNLRKEYSGHDIARSFNDVESAYGRINATDNTAAGDLALIFNYMKMLDPGSVVREGEFATASNTAGVPDRVRNQYNNLMSGERLTPEQRVAFKSQAFRLYDEARKGMLRHNERFQSLADQYGLDSSRIIRDLRQYEKPQIAQPQPAPPQEQIDPNDDEAFNNALQKYGPKNVRGQVF